MNKMRVTYLLALALLLASCNPATPGPVTTPASKATQVAKQVTTLVAATAISTPDQPGVAAATKPPAAVEPTATAAPDPATAQPVTLTCADKFEKSELNEPYKRDKYTGAPRFTYSTEEWQALLGEIGIASICVPVELGSPYLMVDWDAAKKTAQKGRMVIINFQPPANDSPEQRGWLVYSTYDIAVGTEYDRFSMPEDWHAVRRGVQPGLFEANGAQGFARAMPSAYSFGTTTLYQTYVIPSETRYVALVYNLGAYEGDIQGLVEKFNSGLTPAQYQSAVGLFAAMARTIQLK